MVDTNQNNDDGPKWWRERADGWQAKWNEGIDNYLTTYKDPPV